MPRANDASSDRRPRVRGADVDRSGAMRELTNAKRLHGLAQENLRLAEASSSADERNRHRAIAEHFLLLAAAELRSVTERRQSRVIGEVDTEH